MIWDELEAALHLQRQTWISSQVLPKDTDTTAFLRDSGAFPGSTIVMSRPPHVLSWGSLRVQA